MFIAFLFIIIGAVFLLKNLGIITGQVWGILWLLILIVFGLYIALRVIGAECFGREYGENLSKGTQLWRFCQSLVIKFIIKDRKQFGLMLVEYTCYAVGQKSFGRRTVQGRVLHSCQDSFVSYYMLYCGASFIGFWDRT